MKVLVGGPGTLSGLTLRLGQCLFAAASIGTMVTSLGFTNYTAFCYLIASMGLQVLWSLGLACLDFHAWKFKRDLQNPILVSLFVVGDWVTATLSLRLPVHPQVSLFCSQMMFTSAIKLTSNAAVTKSPWHWPLSHGSSSPCPLLSCSGSWPPFDKYDPPWDEGLVRSHQNQLVKERRHKWLVLAQTFSE
ncbi:hypothetical protein QJS10_CPA03g01715 [Acorus calamus]|uniref:CASP-like protein n=1 Tax=Acorus calamus TaxID=4465 RepID=A0AAV9F756_ACOCL|nr:hypothetical protein QJS10_CPA03g01715 [Acorus calamus]